MAVNIKKGERTEELLRMYFLELGYFVVRGVSFKYKKFDVTDIDLWLYARPSPISRERTNVDIKRKKTPQALERIFWTKGLKEVLNLEKCIVVTTDVRPDVREFGSQNDVMVLDGKFIKRLENSKKVHLERIIEEELLEALESEGLGKLGGDWKGRYFLAKARLITKLDFDGANEFIADIHYFMEQFITTKSVSTLRLIYLCTSYFLICMDFILKEYSYQEHSERNKVIEDGIRYGVYGKKRSEEIAAVATSLLTSFQQGNKIDSSTIYSELESQFGEIKAELLGEYFSNPQNMKSLLSNAIEFETKAFSTNCELPSVVGSNLQSILGVICDFGSLDRKLVLV